MYRLFFLTCVVHTRYLGMTMISKKTECPDFASLSLRIRDVQKYIGVTSIDNYLSLFLFYFTIVVCVKILFFL